MFALSALFGLLVCSRAEPLLQSQNLTYNSSFTLSQEQIQAANLTDAEAHNFEVALNFERSNYAGGSVKDDPFYAVPSSFDPLNPPEPGTILKVENHTNASLYTLAPSIAMSRIMYTSETLNGTSIPASAYILWPYTARRFLGLTNGGSNSSTFPVIGLAHGTSGQTSECAPSHIKALWDDFHEPFALALNGYAVVAPDYAGLGVSNIKSPYFVLPSQANDLIHAVQAAQKAYSRLSREFVIMGQSQGGGVAWSYAQRQAQKPVAGYLGTVAISPFTDILANIVADAQFEDNARVVGIAQGLDSVLDTFKMSDWITQAGIDRHSLLEEVGGCGTVGAYLFATDTQILKDGWNTSSAAQWYRNVSDNGNKPFASPMLITQGDIDANANVNVTAKSVEETCAMFPNNTLHYIQYAGISHVPTLYASQYTWLDWIKDRFDGVKSKPGCVQEKLYPATGVANGAGQNWIVEYDKFGL